MIHHTIEIKDGLAKVAIIGDGDEAMAKQFVADAETEFLKNNNQKVNVIVDMIKSGLSDYKGILVYREFLKDSRIGKLSFVVVDPVIKAFVKIAIEFKKNDAEIFSTYEEALEWINK